MKSYPRLIRWLLQIALAGAVGSAVAAAAEGFEKPARFPVTPAQIASALAAHGVDVGADAIVLPMRITAASAAPVLDVATPEPAGSGTLRVRLACRDHAQCLPFYVRLPGQETGVSGVAAHESSKPIALHAGAHATLIIDDHRIHIRVPVICLEPGQPGRTIRVSSLDHKQVYQAEVIDATLLKGSL